jgi:hypothetical protein
VNEKHREAYLNIAPETKDVKAAGRLSPGDGRGGSAHLPFRVWPLLRHPGLWRCSVHHQLFDRVKTHRMMGGEAFPIDGYDGDSRPPARGFHDYAISIDRNDLPEGAEIDEY